MSGRGSRVPRPATGEQWQLRFSKNQAAKTWEQWANSHGEVLARCYDQFTDEPRQSSDRHHQLRGKDYATGVLKGKTLDRWQHEVTGAGRVWALIDDETKTVWVEAVFPGHPSQTDT